MAIVSSYPSSVKPGDLRPLVSQIARQLSQLCQTNPVLPGAGIFAGQSLSHTAFCQGSFPTHGQSHSSDCAAGFCNPSNHARGNSGKLSRFSSGISHSLPCLSNQNASTPV